MPNKEMNQRIAHIVPTRREVNGVSYWDFTLPTHMLSPPEVLPELEADDGDDSSDEDSRTRTPAPVAVVDSCPPLPGRRRRAVGAAMHQASVVTVAQFWGMTETRYHTGAGR